MGAAGQARVKGTFDWAAVIPRYLALWREQQAIRLAVPVTGIPVPIHATWTSIKPAPPGRAAPFATCCGYGRTRRRPPPTSFLWSALPRPLCRANGTKLGSLELIGELNRRGETTVRELLEVLEPTRRSAGQRVVLWLLRMGLAVAV
jgi:hypothetical protein